MDLNKCLFYSIFIQLFSINMALSCPDIEGEYTCGSSQVLKVTQTMEGEFYRYQFHYSGHQPISLLADNISDPEDSDDPFFHTVRCVGDVLEWSFTPIPLNTEGEDTSVPVEPDIKAAWSFTPVPLNTEVEQPDIKAALLKHLNSMGITSFYSLGENGRLNRRFETTVLRPKVVEDDTFHVFFHIGRVFAAWANTTAYDLTNGWLGLSPDEIAEMNIREAVTNINHSSIVEGGPMSSRWVGINLLRISFNVCLIKIICYPDLP